MRRIVLRLSWMLTVALLATPVLAAFPGTVAGASGAQASAQPGRPGGEAHISEQFQYLGTTVFTCTDFTTSGTGSAILDRDNTGTGQEKLNVHVTDGAGTVLFDTTLTNILNTYPGGLLPPESYTQPPVANPITLTVTSLAGNGLPAEVAYEASGTCGKLPLWWAAIPTLSSAGVALLVALLGVAAFVVIRRSRRTA